jgi:hypothetical protein
MVNQWHLLNNNKRRASGCCKIILLKYIIVDYYVRTDKWMPLHGADLQQLHLFSIRNIFFVGCLTTLSVSRLYSVGWECEELWWIKMDFEASGNELIKVLFINLFGRAEENDEDLSHDRQCPVRYSSPNTIMERYLQTNLLGHMHAYHRGNVLKQASCLSTLM